MRPPPTIKVYENSDKLTAGLVLLLQELVASKCEKPKITSPPEASKEEDDEDTIRIAISGGSMIKFLAEALPKLSTDWTRWLFFFTDERMVSFSDPESSFGQYREQVIKHLPVGLNQFITIDPALVADHCSNDYASKMRNLFCQADGPSCGGWPTFDLVLLGMGPDGHTGSLFPGQPQLRETVKWVTFVGDSPKPPPNRITLTLPVLNHSNAVVFVVTGASKADTLKAILVDGKELPAGLVQPESGKLYWLLDEDAAGKLPKKMITS